MNAASKIQSVSGCFEPTTALKQYPDSPHENQPRLLRSPIAYPGSKGRVIKSIANAMPTDWLEFREPFAGGLSLSLYLMQRYPTRRYWVNDLDPFVSCFWVALASEPERLANRLTHYLLEFPSDEDKTHLAEWAGALIHETDGVERAALYYVMSKTAGGGVKMR